MTKYQICCDNRTSDASSYPLILWTMPFPLILMNKPSHQQKAGWSPDQISKSRLIKIHK